MKFWKKLIRRRTQREENSLQRILLSNQLGEIQHPLGAHQDFWADQIALLLENTGLRRLYDELNTEVLFFEDEGEFSQAFLLENSAVLAINFHQIPVLIGLVMDHFYECANDRYYFYLSSMGRIKMALDSFKPKVSEEQSWFELKKSCYEEVSLTPRWDELGVRDLTYLSEIVSPDKVDLMSTARLIFAFLLGHEFGHCVYKRAAYSKNSLFAIGEKIFECGRLVMRTNATITGFSLLQYDSTMSNERIRQAMDLIDKIDESVSEEVMCDFIGELFLASAAHELGFTEKEVFNLCFVLPTQLVCWTVDMNLLKISVQDTQDRDFFEKIKIAASKKDRTLFLRGFAHGFALQYIRDIVRDKPLSWTEFKESSGVQAAQEIFALQEDYINPSRNGELFGSLVVWRHAMESFLLDPTNPNADAFKDVSLGA
jgi:hypothetical protein